jgi:hypothetical protein
VNDAEGHVVASRVLGQTWKDEPARGYQPYPKMLHGGSYDGVIVNSPEEEERVLGITPAEAPAPAPAKSRSRGATV